MQPVVIAAEQAAAGDAARVAYRKTKAGKRPARLSAGVKAGLT